MNNWKEPGSFASEKGSLFENIRVLEEVKVEFGDDMSEVDR